MSNTTEQDLAEICQIFSNLLKVSTLEIREHLSLFIKVDPTIKNCLYYLSKIEDDDLKNSATMGMQYLVNFKKSPFHEK